MTLERLYNINVSKMSIFLNLVVFWNLRNFETIAIDALDANNSFSCRCQPSCTSRTVKCSTNCYVFKPWDWGGLVEKGCLNRKTSQKCRRVNGHLGSFSNLTDSLQFCYTCNTSYCNAGNITMEEVVNSELLLPNPKDDPLQCYNCDSSNPREDCNKKKSYCSEDIRSCYALIYNGSYKQGCRNSGLFSDQHCVDLSKGKNSLCEVCTDGHLCNKIFLHWLQRFEVLVKPKEVLKCYSCKKESCKYAYKWVTETCSQDELMQCISMKSDKDAMKGCVPDLSQLRQGCFDMEIIDKEKCQMCNKSLCNSSKIDRFSWKFLIMVFIFLFNYV